MGYFLFENYFNTDVQQRSLIEFNNTITTLKRSNELNQKNDATLSRIAILELFKEDFDTAFSTFDNTQHILTTGLDRKDLNLDQLFVTIWCAIAQFQMTYLKLVSHPPIFPKTSDQILSEAEQTLDSNISPGPLRCHTFDLQIIDRIFKERKTPITDANLRQIIDGWTQQVNDLDSADIKKTSVESKKGILLIGFGEMGENYHIRTLRELKVPILGIVRKSETLVENIPTYSPNELSDVLKENQPELVIISTPHNLHYEQIKLCLEYKCHVLTEKPLAFEITQAQDLVTLAKEKKRLLVVNLQRRYEGPASVFRDFNNQGMLGEIRVAHGIFYHQFSADVLDMGGWRLDPSQAGAGIIEDSGYHLVDLLAYFSNSPMLEESLQTSVIYNQKMVPQVFSCLFKTENNCLVTATAGYIFPKQAVQEDITLVGTKGTLFIRRFRPEWNQLPPEVNYASLDGSIHKQITVQGMPFGRDQTLKAMLGVLHGNNSPKSLFTSADQVLETHRIIHAIKEKVG